MREPARPLSGAQAGSRRAGAEPPASPEGTQRLKQVLLVVTAAALLAIATAAVQLGPWRYQPLPGAAVALDDFRAAGTPWFNSRQGADIDRATAEIALAGGPRLSYAARWIRPVRGAAYTRVALDIALDGVAENSSGIGAMIAVVSFGRDGKRLAHWPRELFKGSGTQAWHRASLVVPWSDEVAVMRLELVNAGETGVLKARGIEIAPLVGTPWYRWAHGALIAGWGLLGLAAMALVLRHGRPRRAAFAASAAAAFIAVGGVLPEPLFEQLAAPMEQPLVAIGRSLVGTAPTASATPRPRQQTERQAGEETTAPAPTEQVASTGPSQAPVASPPDLLELSREAAMWARRAISHNVIHAGGFGGLALLVAFLAPPVGIAHVMGLAGFAGVTEMLQTLTLTRGANLEDVAVDCLSALAGLALGVVIRLGLARRRERALPKTDR